MNAVVGWFKKFNIEEVEQPKRGYWRLYEKGAVLFNEDGMRLETVYSPEVNGTIFYSVYSREFDTLEHAQRWVEKYHNVSTSMELG